MLQGNTSHRHFLAIYSRPPAADALDGVERLGDGFVATERGEDGGESAEVGEQVPAGAAGQEMEEGETVPMIGQEARS